ncbi:MAG: LamG-like jellyroll fold domain-containing protein [Prosthecobacter sp.]
MLGCWKFDDLPLTDASGHGAQLFLVGASLTESGRFGGGLTCGSGKDAIRHAAVVTAQARHSPTGAFSAEMWVRISAEADPLKPGCLLDKQGSRMEDFRWSLTPANERGLRRMVVSLGYGTFVKEFESELLLLPSGEWRHVAFSYDGAGAVAFFLDSQPVGAAFEERCGAVLAGNQPLSIGDSLATPSSFPGDVDEVRLCDGVRGFAAYSLEVSNLRHVWERMARPLPLTVTCRNLRSESLIGANMTYVAAGISQTFIIPDLEPGASHVSEYGPDTTFRPGSYTLEVIMGSGTRRVSRITEFEIVPRSPPTLRVIMEGVDQEDLTNLRGLACTDWIGITNIDAHCLGQSDRHHHLKVQPRMDEGLGFGLRTAAALEPWRVLLSDVRQHRVDREGKPYQPPDLNASSGGLAGFTENTGQRLMVSFRGYSTWSGVWLNAEPRINAQPGFSEMEREAYRKFSGHEIPDEVQSGGGVDWRTIPGFPANRMPADADPVLAYYRWFWSGGNGWKAVNEAWHYGMDRRRQDRSDVWTLHDSAVRQPSISGSDAMGNYIGDQPKDSRSPLSSGLCMDQLLAMSAASGGKTGILGILPLRWEREQVSPLNVLGTDERIRLADRTVPVRHLSIAPAVLKASLWTALARPTKGFVFTGWSALRTAGGASSVRATHPYAYGAFRDFAKDVMAPLGPMLARRQPLRSSVALLESFTSQMMAGRGIYRGGSPKTLEVWHALQRAHVQADIVYEEEIAAGGLDGRDVLIMTDCDVLPASLVEKLKQWQEAGGKILGDENLCPALKADALISDQPVSTPPPGEPSSTPLTFVENLERLCRELGWRPVATCDNPEVLLHASRTGDATVLFVINDRREAGTYVGQHGLVKENGLPASTTLNLGRENMNVYDLTRSSFVLPKRQNDGLAIPLHLGPSEGRVLLLSPSPLLDMNLDLPETATCGNVAEVRITLSTSGGRPMPAAIPVEVRIRDADGAPAEWDGYHVVEDGVLTLRLELARNETPGTWEVHVRELASGIEAVKWMKLRQ